MRILLLGTPTFAVPTLRLLHADSVTAPSAVFTQPPKRRSRGGRAEPGEVAAAARELGIEVFEVESINRGDGKRRFVEQTPDIVVVAAFGQILGKAALNLPPHGCLNLHPSLLPKYRGAAPVQRAVMDGVVESGISIMRLVRKLDAGPILMQRPWQMDPHRTAEELLAEAADLGAEMMHHVVRRLISGEQITAVEQDDSQATYAPPLAKEDGRLDLSRPATEVVNRVRAVQPWPRGELTLETKKGPRRVLVHRARLGEGTGPAGRVLSIGAEGVQVACGEGGMLLQQLQLEGKPARPARDVANGLRLAVGARFVVPE